MADEIILRERIVTIKAGDTFDQALQGNVLRVTSGAVPLRVQSRDGQLDFTLQSGERAQFPTDTPGLILSHTSGVDQTFTIQVGKGVEVASALVSGVVAISNMPANQGYFNQTLRKSVSNSAVTLVGANAIRRYIFVQNNDNSAVLRLCVDNNTPTPMDGIRLQPGESFEMSGYVPRTAVIAIYETATSQTKNVEVLEG